MSVVIDHCTATTAVHNSFGVGHTGISCMCYTIFMQGTICEKTFRSFQEVILLTYSETTSPCRTSIGSTKCDHLY